MTVLISQYLLLVVSKNGVLLLDICECLQHRLRRHHLSTSTEMPLEIPDPENQFRDRNGARIDFESEELVRIDRVSIELKQILVLSEVRQHLQYLALETFHQLHRDV